MQPIQSGQLLRTLRKRMSVCPYTVPIVHAQVRPQPHETCLATRCFSVVGRRRRKGRRWCHATPRHVLLQGCILQAFESATATRREQIMQARGERNRAGNPSYNNPDTVSGFLTTNDIAKEAGMSERTYQQSCIPTPHTLATAAFIRCFGVVGRRRRKLHPPTSGINLCNSGGKL